MHGRTASAVIEELDRQRLVHVNLARFSPIAHLYNQLPSDRERLLVRPAALVVSSSETALENKYIYRPQV